MAEIKDPRGKHLLGEAVRLLVQAGVTGAAITDFIQGYAEVVHTTLAAPPETTGDLKTQMKEALMEALQELAPPARRTRNELRKQVAVYINGARTTVLVSKDLLEKSNSVLGEEQTRQAVEELANSKPQTHANRSGWVEEQLQHRLLLMKAEARLAGQVAH